MPPRRSSWIAGLSPRSKAALRLAPAIFVITVIAAAAATSARAGNYPSKTITIIAPASQGGVTDLLARMLARRFNADWGAQAIVENKPGANNQVAAEYVAHQPGDGYTLFVGPETTFIVNPSLYAYLAYDPVKDFTPIAGLVSINHALALNPAVPAESVKDLIALGKAKPGQLNYGDYGVGSSGNLNMEMFKAVTGVNFVAVHYKGATPALEDVMAGHIQLMFVSAGTAMPQVKAGTVKIVGVGAEQRMALLPDVPAFRPRWSRKSMPRSAPYLPIPRSVRTFSTRNISNRSPARLRRSPSASAAKSRNGASSFATRISA